MGGIGKVTTGKKEPPEVNFHFPKGAKVQPKGFSKLGMNRKVILILEGTTTSISIVDNEWEQGRSLTVKLSKCDITLKDENADDVYPEMAKKKKG